ncbi:Ankyrin repeat domain-containing protein 1 [Hondaea fermentalgiana]|uniref:Ankyrin repeat domain-containing protein 1 n=1 Tax=Hondaea fermentalgiana TaxID=2315210 RepID=A0A2R5GUQ1_9STRA|nr:Ankyrin repeat domain-containing protein 1 [Hondaea fermentalgiana]|eukprot:GBG31624.1 Ankyrin repeat domain-containing protein 1 [Hondaea fermentalgiana]
MAPRRGTDSADGEEAEAAAALEDLIAKACEAGRTDVVKAALEQHGFHVDAPVHVDVGSDIEQSSTGAAAEPRKRRSTALHIACENGQVDVVRALLKLGARADVEDDQGRKPAEVASQAVRQALEQELLQQVAAGDLEKVRGLLHGGVNANADDGTAAHATILHWAASFGQPRELLQELVNAGAVLEACNDKKRTPMHEACEGGHVETASALLELGASPDARDVDGHLPVELAKTQALRSAFAALFGQLDQFPKDGGENEESKGREFKGSEALSESSTSSSSKDGVAKSTSAETRHNVIVDGQEVASKEHHLVDKDEVYELRRMVEEKDLTIVALRETVESLLEENGVLKYISKLQDEFRSVSSQLQRVADHKEHLQSMYVKCDMELERCLQENAMLRSALHEKEERLLSLLDETASAVSRRVSLGSATDGAHSLRSMERSESIECILMERDRLGKELEAERRLRFSEARLHLGYASDLRKQLQEAQEALADFAAGGGTTEGVNAGATKSSGKSNKSKKKASKKKEKEKLAVSEAGGRDEQSGSAARGGASRAGGGKDAQHDGDDDSDFSTDSSDSEDEQGGGIFSAIYNSIFGDDDDDSGSDSQSEYGSDDGDVDGEEEENRAGKNAANLKSSKKTENSDNKNKKQKKKASKKEKKAKR